MADLAGAEAALREAAIALVQNEQGVRVEDYLATLAAAAGEGALAAAGFDVAGHDLPPGSPLFFEPVNAILTGDTVADVPADSVYGILRDLTPEPPTPTELYEQVARSVGGADWGKVNATVPDDNQPWVLPLKSAYELRSVIIGLEADQGLVLAARHTLTATALREAIVQVGEAIDRSIAVRLALEVTFAMAKTAPMTDAAFAAAAADPA